jgi:hypothetical protein
MNKRRLVVVTICVLAFSGACAAKRKKAPPSGAAPPTQTPLSKAPTLPDGVDVTKEALAANSSNYPPPPTQFHEGHVTPRTLDSKMWKRTANGFEVQFPSHAPIVTPTVYDGVVFTSGGFHSREFYAFEAQRKAAVGGQPRRRRAVGGRLRRRAVRL